MEKAEKAGNTAEAIKWASEWIDAEPNTHFGYSRRAILKVELEDFSGALVDFKKQYQQTYDTKFVMAEIAGIGASIYQKADKYDEQGESGKACYYDAQALPYIQEAKTISAEIGEDIYSGLVKLEKEIETYRANHCL